MLTSFRLRAQFELKIISCGSGRISANLNFNIDLEAYMTLIQILLQLIKVKNELQF